MGVTELEATAALRVAAGSRICQLSLLTHARVDLCKPRSLSLMPTAEILEKQSHNRPEKLNDTDTHWYLKVRLTGNLSDTDTHWYIKVGSYYKPQ